MPKACHRELDALKYPILSVLRKLTRWLANSVSEVYGSSTHVEQEKGCPYQALATPQLRHPLFLPKVISAGLPGKAFPRKHAFVDISVFLWLGKQRPRFAQCQPKGYLQLKELHRTTQSWLLKWMLIERWGRAQYAEFNVPTCGKFAVWLLCREAQPLWKSHDSWWPEVNMFGSMPWCSFPWHKLLPSLAQKDLLYSQSKFDPWVDILVFAKGNFCRFALGRPSHGSMPL